MRRGRRIPPPPFCPNPACDSHTDPQAWRYKKKGFFERARGPRRVQRYLCQHCGRNFSQQTFSTTYWLKLPRLQKPLFWRLRSCSCLRQIAYEFGIHHSTAQRHGERLGRHCMLLHETLRPKTVPSEALVLDGFRSIESGHYWPFDLNLLVGESHYVYAMNEAELRRSGRQTPSQQRKREELEARHGRPDPQATRKAVEELGQRILPEGSVVEIRSDEHQAYPRAFRRLKDRTIRHVTTSSKASRTPRNPLFPANLADLLLRHDSANHKRQTIAFSKRRQGAIYRAAIWMVWRNYMKPSSERRRDAPPGVRIGVIDRAMTVSEVLDRRLFPSHHGLTGWLERSYFARIPTRRLPEIREHALRYAV